MILSNLHTHTKYCDGKNTPEEMVLSAIDKGFASLGFSEHSHIPNNYGLTPESTPKYIDEIKFLKEKYQDKIEIFLGIECDLRSEIEREKYDYIIGSAHHVNTPAGVAEVDSSEEKFLNCVKDLFDGDFYAYCRAYYENVAQIANIKPDIVGHLDLVTKFNEGNKHFSETEKVYLDMAYSAIDALLPHCGLFEINTGAISRGFRITPYPAMPLLKRLHEKGAHITLTSDCHDARFLDCNYKESKEILKTAGFKSAYVMLGGKFVEQPL